MGLFEHFPYVNFHNLNLDWILKKIKDLLTRMDAAEEKLDEHEERLDAAETMLEDHESRLDAAEAAITGLDTRVTAAEADIDDLQSRMTAAEADVDDLQDRMTIAEGTLSDLAETVEEVAETSDASSRFTVTAGGSLIEANVKQRAGIFSGSMQVSPGTDSSTVVEIRIPEAAGKAAVMVTKTVHDTSGTYIIPVCSVFIPSGFQGYSTLYVNKALVNDSYTGTFSVLFDYLEK